MSVHSDQVTSVIKKAVQEVLARGLHDPRVRGLVSVTAVQVSPDGLNATVGVSVLPAEHAELTLHGLRHATRHIQSQVAAQVKMRRVPALTFRLDPTLKRESEIVATINRARRRDAELGPAPPPEGVES